MVRVHSVNNQALVRSMKCKGTIVLYLFQKSHPVNQFKNLPILNRLMKKFLMTGLPNQREISTDHWDHLMSARDQVSHSQMLEVQSNTFQTRLINGYKGYHLSTRKQQIRIQMRIICYIRYVFSFHYIQFSETFYVLHCPNQTPFVYSNSQFLQIIQNLFLQLYTLTY